jgi:hypothetical protein
VPNAGDGFPFGSYYREAETATEGYAVSVVWATVSPRPVVLNGQYNFANPISGTQQFYRLRQSLAEEKLDYECDLFALVITRVRS